MNPLKLLSRLFKGFGALVVRAFNYAQERGLDDALVDHAMNLAREAALKFVDKAARREWAVKQLQQDVSAIPESVARLAVELAVQALKAELTR